MTPRSDFTGLIMIMHPCLLTRTGLEHLISEQLPRATIISTPSLTAMCSHPAAMKATLIISALHDTYENSANHIAAYCRLQSMRQGKPLLILAENETPPASLLKHPEIAFYHLQEQQDSLFRPISSMLNGQRYVGRRQAQPAQTTLPVLTAAEQRVLQLLQEGYRVSQIAHFLHRSVKTVSSHKRRIMFKLNVYSEVELFARMTSSA